MFSILRWVSHVGFVLSENNDNERGKREDFSPGQCTIIQFKTNGDQTGVHRVFIVENQRTSIARRRRDRRDDDEEISENSPKHLEMVEIDDMMHGEKRDLVIVFRLGDGLIEWNIQTIECLRFIDIQRRPIR